MAKAVGIDLGTTNSVVSVLEGGDPVVIPNSEGARTTPSVVAFSKTGEVLVGEVAKRQAITNPDRTFRSVKRHMGEAWKTDDIDGKQYTAQEISARTLMKLKRDAESYLGDTSPRPSSPCPRTSTTRSAPPPRKPARSPVSRCSASSTSRPQQRWPTASTRVPKTRRSSCSTSVAARSTCRCSRSATACSKSSRRTATPSSVATTGTSASSTGSSEQFKAPKASTCAGPHGRSAPQGSSREGQDRAQPDAVDADQPAVHHRHADGPLHLDESSPARSSRS